MTGENLSERAEAWNPDDLMEKYQLLRGVLTIFLLTKTNNSTRLICNAFKNFVIFRILVGEKV